MKTFITMLSLSLATVSMASDKKSGGERRRVSLERIYSKSAQPMGFKVLKIVDSPEFVKAGVEVGDILQSICGIKQDEMPSFVKADQTLMRGKENCEIVVLRGDRRITLNHIAN